MSNDELVMLRDNLWKNIPMSKKSKTIFIDIWNSHPFLRDRNSVTNTLKKYAKMDRDKGKKCGMICTKMRGF